jgi:archaellum biogenesis protein FlaJ (TadC family)
MGVDRRAKFIEDILPDALQLMSSNLRAGLTVDKALLLSVRPEFGPLQDELNLVGKEITTGKEIGEALMNMSKRIRSEKVEKSFLLIISGLKAGGELASLLEQTASNLRDQKFVEDKIRSNVLMYVIFIFVAIGIGAPLLFGLSSFLVEVIRNLLSNVQLPEEQMAMMTLPIKFTSVPLESSFVIRYALISLATSSIMGGFIIGLIAKGKEREGAKYIPLLIIIAIIVFFVIRFIVGNLLGDLFQF